MFPIKKSKETEKEVVIMSNKSFVAIRNLSKDGKSIEIEVFSKGVYERTIVSLENTSVEEFIRKLLQRIKPSTVYYTNSVEDVIEKLHGEQKFSPLKITSLTPNARKAFGVVDAAATTMRTSKTCLPAIKASITNLEEFKAAIPQIAGRLYSNGDFKPLGTFVLPENAGEDLQTILFVSPFNLLNGEIVKGNLTLPSSGFDLTYRHYGHEEVHSAKQHVNVVNVNVSSAEPPVVLYVGTYCLGNSYPAACLVPEDMQLQFKANCQICLTNFSTRKTGKAGSLPVKISYLRNTIKNYLLNGLVEDSELEAPKDLEYYPNGSKGLLDCSDGRSFILGVALVSKKAFEQANQSNANQTRIYPYAVSMWVTSNKDSCLLDDSKTEMLAMDANWLLTGEFDVKPVAVKPVKTVKQIAVETVKQIADNTVKQVAVETVNPPLEVEIVDYKSIFKRYLSDLPKGLPIKKIDPPRITLDDKKSSTIIVVEYTLNMIEQMSSKNCQFHDWSKEDVEKIVDKYVRVCGSLSVVSGLTVDKTDNQSTINLWGLPFTVTKETARDHKGNQFERTLETKVSKEGKITSIKVGSSLGNFMKFFKAVLFMKLYESNTKEGRKGFAANIERLLSKAPEIFVVTSSSLKDCNSNFGYNIAHSYKQVKYFDFDVYRQVSNIKGTNVADDVIKVLVSRNDGKVLGSQIISDSVELIMNEFKTLCHVFHKPGIYLHGLVHANVEHIEKNHHDLYQLIKKQLPDITSDKVVVFTLKTSKGAKRVTLALAKAAELLDGSEMGYALVGKDYNLSRDIGKKYRSLVLPSHIAAPGLAYFLADSEDRPKAKISRNLVFPYQYYEQNPVIVEGYTASEGCFTIDKEYEPNAHLFFVNGSVVQNPERENIFLNSISYAIKQDIAGKEILEVSLDYYVIHRQAKFRGIVKENFIRVDKSLVNHSLNDSKIKNFDFQMVHFQDTIKSDVLYYWLMLIGNTIEFNKDKSSPALAKLISEKEKINESLGFDKDGALVILQVAVLCGVYDNILSIFEKEFSQPVWIHNDKLSASYGNSLATLYENYSKDEGSDWQSVECPVEYRNFIPNHQVKVYSTNSDLSKPDTNILVFFFDEKGKVTSFLQRSMGFVGNDDCPVYTCELFEVSTVREGVGTSSAVPANIRDLKGRIPAKLLSSLIKKGRKSLNKSAMLIAINNGHDFPQIEKCIEFVRNGDNYGISKADKEYLLGLLSSDLNLNTCEQSYFFEYISKKLHSVKFNCEGKYYWLPFLASVNQLRTNLNVSNHICGVFREMLVAVLNGKLVPATTLRSLNAALKSLSTTKHNLKLMPSVDTVSGKVVGAPNIPIDELWVLRSNDPGSAYKMFSKMGFKDNDAVAAFRSPIHSGAILKIKFIDSDQNESNFYKIDIDTIAINPITMYVNYGDFDGDNIYVAKLSSEHRGIKFNDYKYVMNHLKDTTGLDALDAKQTQYIADHYAIKPWSSSTKTLSQIKASLNKATVSDTQFVEQSKDACAIQTISVGLSYSQYMWVEHFAEIIGSLPEGLSLNFPGVTKEVVQRYTQAYENPLGGYSPEAKQAYISLATMRKRDKYAVLTKESSEFTNYLDALKNMSVNVNNEDVVYQVFDLVNRLFFFAAKSDLKIESTERIIAALVVVAFELSRGKFRGFVKRSAPVGDNFSDFNDDCTYEFEDDCTYEFEDSIFPFEDDLDPGEDDLVPQEGKKNYHQVALKIVLDNLESATMNSLRENSLVIQHLLIVVEDFKWLFDSTETLHIENEVLRTYSDKFEPVTTEVPASNVNEVPTSNVIEVPTSNVNKVPPSDVNDKVAESPKPKELMTSKQFYKDFSKNWSRLSDGNEFLDALVEKFSDWVHDNLNNPNCREVCEKFDTYLKYLKNSDSTVDAAAGLFLKLIIDSGADGGSNPSDDSSNPPSGGSNPPSGGSNPPGGGSNPPGGGSNLPGGGGSNPPGGSSNPSGGGSNPPGGGSNPPSDKNKGSNWDDFELVIPKNQNGVSTSYNPFNDLDDEEQPKSSIFKGFNNEEQPNPPSDKNEGSNWEEFVDYDNYESPTLPPSEELVELGNFIKSTLQCRLDSLESSILDYPLSDLPKESQNRVEDISQDVLYSAGVLNNLKLYFIKVFEAQVAEGVFQETLLRLLNDAEDIELNDLYSIIEDINKDDFGVDNEWSYLEAITQKIIQKGALEKDYNNDDIPKGRLNKTNSILFEVPNDIIVKELPAALVERFVKQNVRTTNSNHVELEPLVNLVRHKLCKEESTLSNSPDDYVGGAPTSKLSIEKIFYTKGQCIAFTSNPKHKESEKYCMLSPTSLLVQPEVNKLLYSSVYNLYIAALFSGKDSIQREIMSAPTIEKVMGLDEKYKRTEFSSEERLCILLWSMMYGLSKPSLGHVRKVLLETKGKTLVLISSQSDNERVKNLGATSTTEGFEGVNIVGKLLEIIRDFYINTEVTLAPIYYPEICSSKIGELIPNFSLPIAGDGTGGITPPSGPNDPKGKGGNKIEEKTPPLNSNPMTSRISTNGSSKITTRSSNVVDYQENIDKFEEYLKNQKLYSQVEKQTNYAKLTLEQKAFVAMFILNGLGSDSRKQDISLGNYFLTGEAGSGKTYTVQTLITVLEILNFKVITTATTGIAATNYKGASTVFKALKIKTGLVGDKDTKTYHTDELNDIIARCKVNNSVLRRFDEEAYKGVVLIIDEVSMLTSHNSVLIGELIKAIQKTSLRKRPIQLLLIGDLRQLPPVQNSNSPVTHSFVHSPYFAETLRTPEQKEKHLEFIREEIDKCTDDKVKAELAKERKQLKDCIENNTMFFNSRKVMPTLFNINMFSIKTMELKTNMRQGGDSAFAEELNKLSNGRFQDIQKWLDECPIIASRFGQKLPKDAVHLFWANAKKDEENQKRLKSLLNQGRESFTFIARGDVKNGYRSNYSKKDILEANGVQESITLCEGAVIRIRRNEGPEDKLILANGMRGVVTRILKDRFITTEHEAFINEVPSGLDIRNIITIPGFDATILQEDNHYSIDIPEEGHKVAPNTALFKTIVGNRVDCFYNPSNEEAVFLKQIRWHLDTEDNYIQITAFFDRLDTTQVGIEFREFRTNEVKEVRPCLLFCPEEEGISVAEIYQLPVDLCWASTIHSAQGLTIKEETIVHLNCMIDHERVPVNLLYVACSRLTDSDLLFFEEISFNNSKPWGLRSLKNFYKHDKISSEWMSRGYGFSLIINSKEVKSKVDNPNGSVTVSLV